MNNYPAWWNETITIYNRYENKVTHLVTWYRHVIPGCFWKNIGNKITIDNNVIETDTIICRIRKRDDFLPKYKWIELPNVSDTDEPVKADYFTLGRGDIIVRGEVEDEIIEYGTSLFKATNLIDKYKDILGCMVISEVTINVDGDRGNEHYHIKGE